MSDMQQLVDLAISINLKHKKFKKESGMDRICSRMMWMKESTIYIDVGRGTGKTQYIIDNAEVNDCIFIGSRTLKNEILQRSKNQALKPRNIFTCNGVDLDQFRGHNMFRKCERVYVDEPYHVFHRKESLIQQFYELFVSFSETDPTFIFLGKT